MIRPLHAVVPPVRAECAASKDSAMKSIALAAIVLVLAPGCGERGLTAGEGFVAVPGGKVHYRVMRSGQSATKPPLLLLHGGPGGRSCTFSVLSDLAKERPVVMYDQLGSGRSERPSDTTLWRTDRFVDELAAVREALGLRRVHLLGHSWGGALAAEYLLTKKPEGVLSVTFSSALLSTARWVADARRLRSTLPESVQSTLAQCETVETADSATCQAAVEVFNERFVRGAKALPELPACEGSTNNERIYRQMWGAAEFTATGSLRDFDRTDRLGELRLPVLFLAGRYDEAVPETIEEFQRRVPGARLTVFEASAHASYRTETARYVQVVDGFLREAEETASMWFRVLILVIAVAFIAKGAIALAMPGRFYAERQRQYASATPPAKVLIPPVVISALALVAWYATIFHYQPGAWAVTGSLTAFACLALHHVLRWETHRQKMLRVVTHPKVGRVDYVLLVAGALFVALALLVY